MEAATFSFVSLLAFSFLGLLLLILPLTSHSECCNWRFCTGVHAASMAVTLGYYGTLELAVGPGCSRLLQASSVFVKDITVRAVEGSRGNGGGLVLYGLPGAPPLDVPAEWSEARRVVVPANSHREWVYFLNKGAQIEATYSVNSETDVPYPLFLTIAQGRKGSAVNRRHSCFSRSEMKTEAMLSGKENFTQWSVHDTTSSWHLMLGNGTIQQTVNLSSAYYIAMRNLNDHQDATVKLPWSCEMLRNSIRLPFLGRSVAVVSSGLKERLNSDEQHVTLSYEPRWIVYVVGSAILAVALLLLYEILSMLFAPCAGVGRGGADRRRAPLLTASKEDNSESLGSSYDSVSHDGDDADDTEVRGESQGGDVCTVCRDARRDCFFLPCGHSATCYSCGARIAEEDGSCPFCRRKLKKVRRIFAV